MRTDSLMQRGFTLLALVLAAVLTSASCNEADGTDPWPGVYPPEAEIDRPKGGGAADAGSAQDAALDAELEEDGAAPDAAEVEPDDADAEPDAASNGDASTDAAADGAADAASEAG
jgi:hypothetical protein